MEDKLKLLILIIGIVSLFIFISTSNNLTGYITYSKELSVSTTTNLGFFVEFDHKHDGNYIKSVKVSGEAVGNVSVILDTDNFDCVLLDENATGYFEEHCGECCDITLDKNYGILLMNVNGGEINLNKIIYEVAPIEEKYNQNKTNETQVENITESQEIIEEPPQISEQQKLPQEQIGTEQPGEQIITSQIILQAQTPPDCVFTTNDCLVQDEIIVLNENLSVSSRNLILSNTTLIINVSYDGEYGIKIENNGNISITNNSLITNGKDYGGNASANYFFKVLGGANPGSIELKDSTIEHAGYNSPTTSNQGLYVEGNIIAIENSTIKDGYYGLMLYNKDSIEITNNNFYNNSQHSIYLNNVNNSNITNNNIDSVYGISMYGNYNNLVDGNIINTNNTAISLFDSQNNKLSNNNITTSYYSSYASLYIGNNVINTQIEYNNITGYSGTAISIGGNNINNTIISNNNITVSNTSAKGIVITQNIDNTFIDNNRIIARGAESGIYFYQGNYFSKTIKNNYFSGGRYAIYVQNDIKNLVLDNNTFENFDEQIGGGDKGYIFFDSQNTLTTENILITNNTLRNLTKSGGIVFKGGIGSDWGRYKNITIKDNDFFDINKDNYDNGGLYFNQFESAENIVIENNYFENMSFGPWLYVGKIMKNISIIKNTIRNTIYTATGVGDLSANGEMIDIRIEDNKIYYDTSDYGAISLWSGAENVSINNNNIYNSKYGIYLYYPSPVYRGFNNINITNNNITYSEVSAIKIEKGNNTLLNNNKIYQSLIGIDIHNSSFIEIKNQNLKTVTYGINVSNASDINISNSDIEGSGTKIVIDYGENIEIFNNNLSNYGSYGVDISNTKNLLLKQNIINSYTTCLSLSNINHTIIEENNISQIYSSANLAQINGGNYNIIRNNYISAKYYGIRTQELHNSNITNNTFIYVGPQPLSSIPVILWLYTNSTENLVKENNFINSPLAIATFSNYNNTIENNNITNPYIMAIAMRGGGQHKIRNNRIENINMNSNWPAVLIGDSGTGYSSHNNLFENNIIINNPYQAAIRTLGNNNIIRNNIIENISGYGINVLPGTKNLTLFNNTLQNINSSGIFVNRADDNKIISNIITQVNSIDTGIVLNNSRNNNISGNNISDNLGDGLKLTNSTATITQNIINNNSNDGISNYNLSINETATNITNNIICYNGRYAIWQENAKSLNTPEELNTTNNFCDGSNNEGRAKQVWYVQVRVIDNAGNVSGANVSIYEPYTNTTPKYEMITDSNGLTPANATIEYEIDNNGNSTFFTPHKIKAEKDSYSNETILIINESRLYSLGNEMIITLPSSNETLCSCLASPNIKCELHHTNCIVNYNVTRNNDTIIDNTTLYVNASYDGEFGFNFTSGKVMIANNSKITNGADIGGNASARYFFVAEEDTDVNITNSFFEHIGYPSGEYYKEGLTILSDSSYILGNFIFMTKQGIKIYGNSAKIYNNNISEYSESAISIFGNYSEIINNSIENGYGIAILLYDGKGHKVVNNKMETNISYMGIRVRTNDTIISNNVINGSGDFEAGIYIWRHSLEPLVNITISDNIIDLSNSFNSEKTGICLETYYLRLKYSTFTNNKIYGAVYGFFSLLGFLHPFELENVNFTNNFISQSEYGLYLENVNLTNSNINNNIISNINNTAILINQSLNQSLIENSMILGNNIYFSGGGIYIIGNESGNTNQTLKIINNLISNMTGTCIFLYSLNRTNITNNTIHHCENEGIYAENISKSTIDNNIVYNTDGIELRYSYDNAITNNIEYLNGYGIRSLYSNNNSIINNRISQSLKSGISLENTNKTIIHGNILTNNTVSAITSYYFANNIISNNIISEEQIAIFLEETSNNTIRNNTLFNNSLGINISSVNNINNSIYFNYFINNTIQASDESCNGCNFWYILSNTIASPPQWPTGNYWSDIFETPLNITDSNNDGWGDNGSQYPYSQVNGANAIGFVEDYGPLLKNATPPSGGGGGGGVTHRCGDKKCDYDETCETCPEDCGECPEKCGDKKCGVYESCVLCPQDCGECPIIIKPETKPQVKDQQIPQIIKPSVEQKPKLIVKRETSTIAYLLLAVTLIMFLLSPAIMAPKNFVDPLAITYLDKRLLRKIRNARSICRVDNKIKQVSLTPQDLLFAAHLSKYYKIPEQTIQTLIVANKHFRPRVYTSVKIPEPLKKEFRHIKYYRIVRESGKILKEEKIVAQKEAVQEEKYIEKKKQIKKNGHKIDTSKIDELLQKLDSLEK